MESHSQPLYRRWQSEPEEAAAQTAGTKPRSPLPITRHREIACPPSCGEITRFDVDSVPFFSPASKRSRCQPLLASRVISSLQLRRFSLSLSLAAASLTVAELISPANGKPVFGRMWHLRCVERENKQIKHFISGLWQLPSLLVEAQCLFSLLLNLR